MLALMVRHGTQGIKLVVDNTFSPMMISPARWGADVVIHSLTKFVSGASDVIAGAPKVFDYLSWKITKDA